MPEEQDQQSPEILKQIQAAERNVKRMVHAAEEEARAMIEKARVQAKALAEERRKVLEERRNVLIAAGIREAQREAKRCVAEAREKADRLKTNAAGRIDEAMDLVLRRILPAEPSAFSRKTQC